MAEWTATVMVVEDDETIALGVTTTLKAAGYRVHHFDRGETALAAVAGGAPDVVILDLMLPGMDGLEVLTRLKETYRDLPVILLTARSQEEDRIKGLDAGADDYVAKPFSLRELLSRVKARLRSKATDAKVPESFEFGHVTVDLHRRVVISHGEEHRLTTHEAGVLGYLISHRGHDVSRDELLEKVWGYSPSMNTRTVDNQILKLRKKIEDEPADPRHILTVHGKGYRFET